MICLSSVRQRVNRRQALEKSSDAKEAKSECHYRTSFWRLIHSTCKARESDYCVVLKNHLMVESTLITSRDLIKCLNSYFWLSEMGCNKEKTIEENEEIER